MKKLFILPVLILMAVGCSNSGGEKSKSEKSVSLAGAGATFPMPFYNLVFKNYTNTSGILVTYGGIGSGMVALLVHCSSWPTYLLVGAFVVFTAVQMIPKFEKYKLKHYIYWVEVAAIITSVLSLWAY